MASYDQIQQLATRMTSDKGAANRGAADTISSLNLLKNMFEEDSEQRIAIEQVQKAEVKYILAGISALNGPRGGQLTELLGGNGMQQASIIGELIKQQESENLYKTTISTALDQDARTRLGFDDPQRRGDALNGLITRR